MLGQQAHLPQREKGRKRKYRGRMTTKKKCDNPNDQNTTNYMKL